MLAMPTSAMTSATRLIIRVIESRRSTMATVSARRLKDSVIVTGTSAAAAAGRTPSSTAGFCTGASSTRSMTVGRGTASTASARPGRGQRQQHRDRKGRGQRDPEGMLAAHIPGARAVAEVPQLNFALWLPSAVVEVEQYILGEPVKEFRKRHPERVSVLHRFLFAGRIPEFSILTNGNDFRIAEQRNFMQWVRKSKLPKNGMNLLIENDTTFGHEVLPQDQLVQFVQP